ncbi:MAG TPA: hypothetical protein PLX38_10895 [Gammaproteobacteria bacterium]|nr:hypothetical protein [Gammaproteobacteria bacterium]
MLTRIFLSNGNIETRDCRENYFVYMSKRKDIEKKIISLLKDSTLEYQIKVERLKVFCNESFD